MKARWSDGVERIGWRTIRRRSGRTGGLPPGAEADARLLPGVRDLVRVHLGGGRHFRHLRRRAAERGARRDLALAHRCGRADTDRAWDRPIRGPDPTQRLLLPMGLAAGQPEDRLVVRM